MAHQGRIWVESEEGVGSTFSFSLPITQSLIAPQAVDLQLDAQHQADRAAVLVVDPDPRVAVMVSRYSKVDAIQVEHLADLPREIDLHHPQAVIYNTLPGTAPNYGEAMPDSVVSFTCSLPSQSWIAANLQVAACLTKPVGTKDLLSALDRLDQVKHVLVIDNDRGFCHLIERMINSGRAGIEVEIALDGLEGLEVMRTRQPDLVLLDLMMPEVDGFEVIEQMRGDPRLQSIPIILLTATSYSEDALAQRSSRIIIERGNGLHPAETLRCLNAVLDQLHSDYGSAELAIAVS